MTSFSVRILISFTFVFVTMFSNAQVKRALQHSDYDAWKELKSPVMSVNGKIVCYEKNPQLGDGWLMIYQTSSHKLDSIPRGYDAQIATTEDFIVYKIKPSYQRMRKAKLDKKKPEDMPKDSLGIFLIARDTIFRFGPVKSFVLPEKFGNWLAFLSEKEKEKKKEPLVEKDTVSVADTINSVKRNNLKPEGTNLSIFNPVTQEQLTFKNVTEYTASRRAALFSWIAWVEDTLAHYAVNYFDASAHQKAEIFNAPGKATALVIDELGHQLAFMHAQDSSGRKGYQLMAWQHGLNTVRVILDSASSGMYKGWGINPNQKPWFSQNGERLFLGTAPLHTEEPKDTLTEDEKYSLDIWHWQDPLIQSQQKVNLEKEKKRTWLAELVMRTGAFYQLADTVIKDLSVPYKGNKSWALGYNPDPYQLYMSWEDKQKRDCYLVNLETGKKKKILNAYSGSVSVSPLGKFLAWYEDKDSSWYCYEIATGEKINISRKLGLAFYDELNDIPSLPSSYGLMGWSADDRMLLVYDRYDVWGLDPSGKQSSKCITDRIGRKGNLEFRYIRTDPEEEGISVSQPLWFFVFNEKTRWHGIARIGNILKPHPEIRIMEPRHFSFRGKALNAEKYLWTSEDFNEYPDLLLSSEIITDMKKISNVNPNKNNYLWGNVRLVSWNSNDGSRLEGLLYTPENIDTTQKYPMLVYFYERNADNLYSWSNPAPSRSIINKPYCVSNGYVVFVPDIVYKTGYPGRSAYDAVISGTNAMLDKFSFIDRSRLGMNGQSWGGYQVAWLVTRTDMFRCTMAGAPVSNMTSAYGGIRWESGMSRMFQYEQSQSRIGGTLWDKPMLFLENSPVFSANTIHTPLLIMHNDADGAVPWYQGIELYMALRRLQKPCWLLSYNKEQHNLTRRADMMDLSIRMMEFYDFYLQNKPEPLWMKKGIPAIDKGKVSGY